MIIHILVIVGFLFIPCVSFSATTNLGEFGRTYPIAEQDALAELESRAASIDWEKSMREKAIESARNYRPDNVPDLPRATKNGSFKVDMTYTLDFDIPNGDGGILYPKGFQFNPLDYTPVKEILIVLNAEDPDQLEWFKKSEYRDNADVYLLITKGSYIDLSNQLKRPVYYALPNIVDRFNVRAVPSVIRQADKMMEVKELVIPNKQG